MFFKQLATREASLSYFFGCAAVGKSVAVDVVDGDEDWFVEEARRAGVLINYVWITGAKRRKRVTTEFPSWKNFRAAP